MNIGKINLFLFLITNNLIASYSLADMWNKGVGIAKTYFTGEQAAIESAEKTVIIHGQNKIIEQQATAIRVAAENQTANFNALETFGKGLEKRMQKIGAGLENNTQAVNKVASTQAEINKTLQNINTGAQVIGGAVGAIYIVKSVKDGVEWVQEYRNPDPTKQEEKEDRKEAIILRRKIRNTRSSLNQCLSLHRRSPKDANGLPYSCDEAYHAFAAAAGYEEAEHVAQVFKRSHQ